MIFPTVECFLTSTIHAIATERKCMCGFVYNYSNSLSEIDLKKIKFIFANDITCDLCKGSLQRLQKPRVPKELTQISS
jgi:hypothetical protein